MSGEPPPAPSAAAGESDSGRIVVELAAHANLAPAAATPDWAARGASVAQTLQAEARSSQAQAQALQAQPKQNRSEALRLLELSVQQRLGATARMQAGGERVTVTLLGTAADALAEYERDGGEIRNGSDLPRIARANKILDLARSYGIEPSEFDDVDDPAHIPAPSDTYHY